MNYLRPSSIIIDIYRIIQDYPEAGRWAIELRFLPKPIHSEWVLLNDIEDKVSDIDRAIINYNIKKKKDAYISMVIHDFEKVTAKLKRVQEENKTSTKKKKPREITLDKIQGDSETTSDFTLALVVDIDNTKIHDTKIIEDEGEAFEASKRAWDELKPKLQKLGFLPRWVLYTGGGLQLWFVSDKLEPISVIDRASRVLPNVMNGVDGVKGLLSEGFKADNIFDPARIVRVPLTHNYKYSTIIRTKEGGKRIAPLPVKGRVIEFNDVRISLTEFLDRLEAYAKEKGIPLEKPQHKRFLELASKRYEVTSSNFEDLAERLFQELKPWWEKANERKWSRHHLTMGIVTYILRNTNLTPDDLIGAEASPGLWELVFAKLVEAGLEDPDDWKNRASTIKDAYKKIEGGKKVATKAYLQKYIEGLSEEDAVQILLSVKKALLPYIKAVDVKRISKYDAKPYDEGEDVPKAWEEVDEDRRKATGIWYIDVLALETADSLYFDDLPKPGVFFRKRGDKLKFNEALYQSFLTWLGVKEEEPVDRVELIDILVEKFGLDVEDLKAIYYRKIFNLLKPEGMRTPKCIQEFLLELATEGNLPEDKVCHLAHWIKFYARPLRHSTTSVLLKGRGKPVDMRLAIWAKVVEFFAEDDEVAEELIITFKKAYEEAVPPFPCIGAKTCPFYPDHRACPFIVPKRKEVLPVSIVDVQLHGSDGIVVLVGGPTEVTAFTLEGKVEWIKTTKKTVKYPIAEWFLDRFAKEYLTLPEAPSWWDPEEVTEILKSRARVVKSQFDKFEDYLEQFIEWLQKENSRRGILPYEKADENHLFIKGEWIGIPPGFAREFYSGELLIGGPTFRRMLEQKLGKDYRKAPVKIYLNTGLKDRRNCYFVSVEWFRKYIGEPNVQEVTSEGDVSFDGLTYDDEDEGMVE